MLPVEINGMPAHVLLIHVVIVLLPVAALMLVASAVWPAARAKLGFLTPAVALVALVFVPITTHAGKWLQHHLQGGEGTQNPLILRHAQLGESLLPWAIGIFVMSAVVWLLGRRYDPGRRTARGEPAAEPVDGGRGGGGTATATLARPRTRARTVPVSVTAAVAALSIAVSVGGVVQLYRIGDSGAKAIWTGRTTN